MSTLESTLTHFIQQTTAAFTLKDAIKAIKKQIQDIPVESVERAVRTCIEEDLSTFSPINDDKTFIARALFFKDQLFSIRRTDFEIKNHILIPGGRFAPFCHASLFPSELKLKTTQGRFLKTKVISISIEDAAAHCYLQGAEDMFHYFDADDERNASILSQANPENQIFLTVYDLCGLEEIQTLKIKVLDFNQGLFSLTKTTSLNYKEPPTYLKDFEEALCLVFDQFSTYIELPDQVAHALYYAPKTLTNKLFFDIEHFLAHSKLINISIMDSRTLLWRSDEAFPESETNDEDNLDSEIPEGLALSRANVDSVDGILEAMKCPITPTEIFTIMLDELYAESDEFERFFMRLNDAWPLKFEDELQETVFKNQLEMLFEDIRENYNRVSDNDRGKVRHMALKINNERLRWLRKIAMDPSHKPNAQQAQLITQIAKHANLLHRLMDALNQGTVIEDATGFDEMLLTLSDLADQSLSLMKQYDHLN